MNGTNILQAVSAEGVKYTNMTDDIQRAHDELIRLVCPQQRKLLHRIEDEKDILIYDVAHDNYLRGLCQGLAFAEAFLRSQHAW